MTTYDGTLLDSGGAVYNLESMGVLGLTPGANIASALESWMASHPGALEVLIPASNDDPLNPSWLVDNLTIPAQWLVEGVGIHRTFLQGTASSGVMVSESTSAVKVSLANLRIDGNSMPYAALLSLGFVDLTKPWGSEGYIQNVWVRDAGTVNPVTRARWAVRLYGNVVEVDGLKVYGGRRALQINGTAVRATRLTLVSAPERVLEVLGTSHTLHQVEAEGFGNGTVPVTLTAAAAAGSTSLSVAALQGTIPSQSVLTFSGGQTAVLTAQGDAGTNTLSVLPLTSPIAVNATAAYVTTILTATAAAASGATTLTVSPLPYSLPAGATLAFSGGVTATLVASAKTDATTLSVQALPGTVAANATASYLPPAPIYIDASQVDISGMLVSCAANTHYPALLYLAPANTEQVHISGLQVITRSGSTYGAVINHDGLLFGRQTLAGSTITDYEPRWFEYDTAVQQTYYVSEAVAAGATGEMPAGTRTLTIKQVHPGMRIVVGYDVSSDIVVNLAGNFYKLGGKTYTIINNSHSGATVYVRGSNSMSLLFADQRVTYDPAVGFPVAPNATLETTPAQGNNTVVSARYSGRFVVTSAFAGAAVNAGSQIATGPIAFPGVQTGDFVEATLSIPAQGVRIWGDVTASGQVTVYFRNDTGVNVLLAAGTIQLHVRKRV